VTWFEAYPKEQQPSLQEIERFIASPLWNGLCSWTESTYTIVPKAEHSTCSGAPGWNVKYKKGGRALCTLYPDRGQFTALVTVGTKEAAEAELLLPTCTDYIRELFARAQSLNGGRWLMIRVTDEQVLEDVKKLIRLRVAPKE
jgi:hypothetical protein